MQAELGFRVVPVKDARKKFRGKLRVIYGQYNTICTPEDVWNVKQQMKLLPIICPACKRQL